MSLHQLRVLLSESLARSAAGTLVLRGCFVALEFACGIAVARVFQASGYGIYALVLSWVTLLGVPAAAGFDRLLVREVSTHRVRGEWALVRGIVGASRRIVLLVSASLALLVAGVASLLAPRASGETVLALQIGMVLVPLVAFARVRQAILQGLGRVVVGQVPETLAQPLVFLGLIGLSILWGLERTGLMAVALYIVSYGAATLLGIVMLRRSVPTPMRLAGRESRTGVWVRSAAPFMLMLGMNMILTYADTILVGAFAGSTPAGIYRVASQMAMLVAFPLTCVNMAVAPSIAALYAKGDMAGLQERARMAARFVLLMAVPIAIVLFAFGPKLLAVFGADFVAGYGALVILTSAYVINAAAGTAGYLLIMTRYERSAAIVFACAAAINISGHLLLIPVWGIRGAAIATGLSVVVLSVAFAVLAWRNLRVSPIAFASPRRFDGETI